MNATVPNSDTNRFYVLDGWRGLAILFVLATHLMPLGPKAWHLNATSGPLGMAIFFTLSGFLITHFLLNHTSVIDFLIRRFFRIIPLAWLYIAIALAINQSGTHTWLAHLFFYANWPPMPLTSTTSHFWSLCVEVQFYVSIALLVAILKQRGLLLIPLLCLAFTLYRVSNEVHIAVNTYYRIDEILAGSILALIHNNRLGALPRQILSGISQFLVFALLVVSCHPESGVMNYLRLYLVAILVGATLFNAKTRMVSVLNSRVLFYIAAISYALYVIHPILAHSLLGSGDDLEKYLKRPLLFLVLFALAHLSTYSYEHRCIAFGKHLTRVLRARGLA